MLDTRVLVELGVGLGRSGLGIQIRVGLSGLGWSLVHIYMPAPVSSCAVSCEKTEIKIKF